jgi:hypothetical protein
MAGWDQQETSDPVSLIRPSATFTSEFGHEFEAERERLLRRRFLWYTGVNAAFGAIAVIGGFIGLFVAGDRVPVAASVVGLCANALLIALYVAALMHVRRSHRPRVPIMRLAYWLIVITGVAALAVGVVSIEIGRGMSRNAEPIPGVSLRFDPEPAEDEAPVSRREDATGDQPADADRDDDRLAERDRDEDPLQGMRSTMVAASGIWQIFVAHFFACLFLPWTPRESARPLVPLLAINAVITLIYMIVDGSWLIGSLIILLSPLIGTPGMGICWWRHSRLREGFHSKLVMRRYGEMRQELVNARQIHESLFPKPCTEGPARFSYRYEPMRQIGGDYLYASRWNRPDAEHALSLVIIDVTGHGIPAALTVNRLHGELERIFAEDPGASPGEVLRLLNRYVHLTLATHSVYVTAVCLRIDPDAGTLEYASGGHPPAFIRAVDGHIDELNSTAFVLGVCGAGDFEPEPQTLPFGPGDTLIAYTDGAIEARDRSGRMYGISGLRRLISQGRPDALGGWPAAILGEVEAFRFGPAADDTLIIEVVRPLRSAPIRAHASPDSGGARVVTSGSHDSL